MARQGGKESACKVGDLGLIPGLGRSPGEGKGYPFQCSGLENSTVCIVHGILQARILDWIASPFSSGSSQISHLAGRFLPPEPQGTPQNSGVGSQSLLQGIFLSQELNLGLLHCRWILYQLSHRGIKKVVVGDGHICGFGEEEFSANKHSFCKRFSVSLKELMSP